MDAKSGVAGRIFVKVIDAEIRVDDALSLLAPSDGAVVIFGGTVRDATDGRRVTRLDYEVYSEMAEEEMSRIAAEALSRWPVGSIAMMHRVGSIEIGEYSVVVAVTSPHRGEAFDACEYCIDTLKKTVPIWKKEIFEDGSSAWVDHP